MKRKFPLSHDVISIHFTNKARNSEFVVNYRLYDHPVAHKWLKLMKKTQVLGLSDKFQHNGIFFGNQMNDKAELVAELKANVKAHNRFCDSHGLKALRIPITVDAPPTQERLNELHHYFEVHVQRPEVIQIPPMENNLLAMNINIHRLESCLDETSTTCHIEVLAANILAVPLEGSDYNLFSPDFGWGELFLTYGVTGVPTLNAFYSDSHPTPQHAITNGMIMAFWGDQIFDQYDEARKWLKNKKLDIKDPKTAFGYIPLGVLENVEGLDRKVFLKKLSQHSIAKKFHIHDSNKDVRWPHDPEIFYHLDLVPYIDLKIKFDAKTLLKEAKRLLPHFVVHREYDQSTSKTSGKWKSLALHALGGDPKKTQYHTEYSFDGEPIYLKTKFAKECPETMKLLERITDVSQCERVRFMLLEPGASIKVHRDSKDRDVCFAVNISLNMPKGCEFHAQLNPDGTENPYSLKLPFSDSGSVFLFNNAKYHKVVNHSKIPRIHIIFHGPIRLSDEELLKLAQAQNGITNRKELLKRLIQKKAHLGEELDKTPSLYGDWIMAGLHADSLPAIYSLAVYDHKKYAKGESSDYHLRKRTLPSLFPLGHELIEINRWDAFLREQYEKGAKFAVIMAAGTFITDTNKFIKNLISECRRLEESGWPAMGHIMDFKGHKQLPYFHEQFLIINLKVWSALGKVSLGPLFTPFDDFYVCSVSSEKIHDDYTPTYIRGGDEHLRRGSVGWGSQLIKVAVEAGLGVLNLSSGLRECKHYTYPRDGLTEKKEIVEKLVNDQLSFSKNEVYYFNNENLEILNLKSLRANKVISVAAGLKPFHILKQFNVKSCDMHFVDFSEAALDYMAKVVQCESYSELESTIVTCIEEDRLKKYDREVAVSALAGLKRDFFQDSDEVLISNIQKARKARFHHVNLMKGPAGLSKFIEEGDRFIIWISNAFYNNSLFLLLTPEEAEKRLLAHVRNIMKKSSLRAFRLEKTHTFVFGKTLKNVQGLLTDGSVREAPLEKELWHEI